MGRWLRASAICACLAGAAPGSATVIYTLTAPVGSFTYQTDDFIRGRTRVAAGDLAACWAGPGLCNFVDFIPHTLPTLDEVDLSQIFNAGQPSSYSSVARFSMPAGTLAREGVFATSNGGTLQVASVPEPATWTAMLAGLGAVGAALRRRGPSRRAARRA